MAVQESSSKTRTMLEILSVAQARLTEYPELHEREIVRAIRSNNNMLGIWINVTKEEFFLRRDSSSSSSIIDDVDCITKKNGEQVVYYEALNIERNYDPATVFNEVKWKVAEIVKDALDNADDCIKDFVKPTTSWRTPEVSEILGYATPDQLVEACEHPFDLMKGLAPKNISETRATADFIAPLVVEWARKNNQIDEYVDTIVKPYISGELVASRDYDEPRAGISLTKLIPGEAIGRLLVDPDTKFDEFLGTYFLMQFRTKFRLEGGPYRYEIDDVIDHDTINLFMLLVWSGQFTPSMVKGDLTKFANELVGHVQSVECDRWDEMAKFSNQQILDRLERVPRTSLFEGRAVLHLRRTLPDLWVMIVRESARRSVESARLRISR